MTNGIYSACRWRDATILWWLVPHPVRSPDRHAATRGRARLRLAPRTCISKMIREYRHNREIHNGDNKIKCVGGDFMLEPALACMFLVEP